LTGVFSPATRGNGSYTTYRMRCTCWWVVDTKKGGGTRSTAHEHRRVVGMLFRYLIWLEVGQKGVVDVEVARVFTGGDGGTVFWWLGCQRAVEE
jgi:hypothetical protein